VKDPYAGEVAYTDEIVGRIVKELDLSKSILAVVGDHGEGLGEHQENTHSVLIYNSTLHVPMLITAPGLIPPGIRIGDLCRTIDLAPTLLDYAGMQKTFGEGVSLRNRIEGKPHKELFAYSESLYPKLNLGWSELFGLENKSYRYIHAPKPEFYDLQKDPAEKKNQISTMQQNARKFQEQLQKLYQSPAKDVEEVDAETREKLSSLGYTSTGNVKPTGADPKDKIGIWNEIQSALFLMASGENRKAVGILKKVLSTEKNMPVVYDYLGKVYFQMQDWMNAEQTYRQAIQSGIESPQFHMNLGIISWHKKDFTHAEKELQSAVRLDPSNVTALYHLGNVYRARGDLQKAMQQYQQALKINPNYVYALNGLGMTYASLKREQEALDSFEKAIKIDTRNAPAYFNLAVQLERMQQPAAALEAYKKFLQFSNEKDYSAQRAKASDAIQRLQ
jgi:tetratricopeptide (TPR) repeat protein